MNSLIQEKIELSPLERLAFEGIVAKDSEDAMCEVSGSMGHRSIYAEKHLLMTHPEKAYEAALSITEASPSVAKAVANYLSDSLTWTWEYSWRDEEKAKKENPPVDYQTYLAARHIPSHQRVFFAADLALRAGIGQERIIDYLYELMQSNVGETHFSRFVPFWNYILPSQNDLRALNNGRFLENILKKLPEIISPEDLEELPAELKTYSEGFSLSYNGLLGLNPLLDAINSMPLRADCKKFWEELERQRYPGPGFMEEYAKNRQKEMHKVIEDIRATNRCLRIAVGDESFARNYGRGETAIESFAHDYDRLIETVLPKTAMCHDRYFRRGIYSETSSA